MVSAIFSCKKSDDFLTKSPLSDYSDEDVWSDPALVETFINSMYRNAMAFPFGLVRLSDFSDESLFTPDWGVADFNKGLMTSDDPTGWWLGGNPQFVDMFLDWSTLYANIRRTNIFFSKINSVPGKLETINELKGEVYFLRAWNYLYLTSFYGGVPIITKAYTLSDNYDVQRNSYEECINFIVGQLDSAAMYLSDTYPTNGHISKGAALALKSRTLLYAASELHNPSKNAVVTSGFSNPELLGYVGGDASARWTAAKNAAKAVIELGKYSLYKANPEVTDSVAQNFVDFFTSKGTEEDILLQFFTPKTDEDWYGYDPGMYSGPNGYHNWGNTTPLGDLVDDYEMKDGRKFDWNNPEMKTNPYINRDARFYASILYEGVQWRVRPSDALAIDPYSKIQIGYVYDTNGNMVNAGLDTRSGPIEDWNGGFTGYYLRKYIDPNIDPQYVKQDVPFKQIRYGEILLNYAEACIELGQDNEALSYINMIRKRAGQPNLTGISGDDLRDAYRHERRIELAFENHRFWDVRRWLIGSDAYHQTSSVDVKYITNNSKVDSYRQPNGSTWGPAIYSKKETPNDARAWIDKCYFFPIDRSEINKNTNLVQNPGY